MKGRIVYSSDVLVIGAGIAGCVTALNLAKKGIDVILVSAGGKKNTCSYAAQGGIVFKGVDDTPKLLAEDIVNAGAGLCWQKTVDFISEQGPKLVEEFLIRECGVNFDRCDDGSLFLTREAAHTMPRILCCRDHTGRTIIDTLMEKIEKTDNIRLLTDCTAIDLITLAHHSKEVTDIYRYPTCVGAYIFDNQANKVDVFFAKETVLATGGAGAIFLHTSNPLGAIGAGIAMAHRAGVRIMNMEYVQFHPTTLYIHHGPRFLLSEALRGEGAKLLSFDGRPFMHEFHDQQELAPRDVVARSIYLEMLRHNSDHVWLDLTSKPTSWIKERFPTIYQRCYDHGYDMGSEPIPVVPAAHYLCGGIAVDRVGHTSMHRLRAVGEVACSGVHGANRLASVSLLEGLVWGCSCADDIANNIGDLTSDYPEVEPWVMSQESADLQLIQQDWLTIRQTMWNYVGLVRGQRRLERALRMLQGLEWEIKQFYAKTCLVKELVTLRHGIQTALIITQGALLNKKSRGCHCRKW